MPDKVEVSALALVRTSKHPGAVGAASATQLWIVGAGPAALLLAEACASAGVRVGIVAPDPRAPWRPNYAMWLDDATALGVEAWLARAWPASEVRFADGPRELGRGYALLDDRALQLHLLARLEASGARIVAAELVALRHDDEGVELEIRGDELRTLRSQLVVDATGHGSRFVAREPGPAPAYQVAWGELWPAEAAHPDRVTFMDWTDSGDEAGESLPPTFLYTLPHGPREVFYEETVLAARFAHPPAEIFDRLQVRLHRRLDRLGVARSGEPRSIERCLIPMGAPLPRGDQRTLAYGGAASMVHPATGYMLTTALRRRGHVAATIAEELARWVSPGAPSRRIWQAIWPPDAVRAWRLYGFGLEVLCALDRRGVDRFFAEFFALPESRWHAFVSGRSPTPELMATMLRYYATVPRPIRARLRAALLGREGLRMLQGFGGLSR